MSENKKQLLKDLYYNPSTGYNSLAKFYKKVREKYPNIKYNDVVNFLVNQYTYQVNKQNTKPKLFSSIMASKVRDNFQIDIIIYDRYEIHRYKYILCVIDVHSRFAQCRAMTNRENDTIIKNLEDIFEVMGVPKNINGDNEFNTKKINEFFNKDKVVKHYSDVGEINKNAIVERFNRTLANLIQKYRVGSKNREWYKVLNDIVDNYNNTYHRTIKAKPIDVFNGKDTNKQQYIYIEPTFRKGDIVRIRQVKNVLGKGDYLKFSEDTYLITSQKGAKFHLRNTRTNQDERRGYKDYELKKVEDIETYVPLDQGIMEKDISLLTKQNKKMKKVLKELEITMKEKTLNKELGKSNYLEREAQLNKLNAQKIRALANKYQIEGRIKQDGRYNTKEFLVKKLIDYETKQKIIKN